MHINRISFISVFFVILLVVASSTFVANAQLNNKPFSFKGTPDGGVGISSAGKQAIINYENFNIKPGTILRGNGGALLNVTEGLGSSVIVTPQGSSTIIPSYSGTSWKGNNESAMSAGSFNAYFISGADSGSGSSTILYSPYYASSSDTVSTWTSRVATNGYPASYSPGSVVDKWTSMVFLK